MWFPDFPDTFLCFKIALTVLNYCILQKLNIIVRWQIKIINYEIFYYINILIALNKANKVFIGVQVFDNN